MQPPNHYSNQFPSSPPATAVPSHLAPHGHPTTYNTATANNILTDDASILTLASSSKRRRRNSLDTNASVRALAPASMFGGSRESLPLSVLSGPVVETKPNNNDSMLSRNAAAGMAAERASLISSSGIAPALASERNSYHGNKGDAASVRSGLLGGTSHGRNNSFTNSITGLKENKAPSAHSPLVEGGPGVRPGALSRTSSGWGEKGDEEVNEAEELHE